MNFKLPETIWQADSLKELKKMPTKRLLLLLTPNYLTSIGVFMIGVSALSLAIAKLIH